MLLSYAIVDFKFFYDVTVDMQTLALLTRSQYRVFDTQVTFKACDPLVFLFPKETFYFLFFLCYVKDIVW